MKTGITINDTPVEVPSSWDELTFKQALNLKQADTDAQTMAVLTGIDIEYCNQISPDIMAVILAPMSELGEVEAIDNPLIFGKEVPKAIGKLEYARKVNCDNAVKKYKDEELIGRIVSIYCADGIEDEDIELAYGKMLDEPLPNVISAGKVISDQLTKMQESEAKIPSPIYESEELRAGIKEFAKYGNFGLVRGIAMRHHCTMQDVYKWPYNSVILELRISADESAYQRKLNRILSKTK